MATPVTNPVPFRLSNVSAPFRGPMPRGNAAFLDHFGVGDANPEPGHLWMLDTATVTLLYGPDPGESRFAWLYAQPVPAKAPLRGDGPILATTLPYALNSGSRTGYGGPGAVSLSDLSTFVDPWPCRQPLTEHVAVGLASDLGAVDQVSFTVTGSDYTLQPGQQEIFFDNVAQPWEPGVAATGSEVSVPLGVVPPGKVWIPITAQVNNHTGTRWGPRRARIAATSPIGLELLPLADTGIFDTLGLPTYAENVTGHYAPWGTAPRDRGNHTLYPAGRYYSAGMAIEVRETGPVGDFFNWSVAFLESPDTLTRLPGF